MAQKRRTPRPAAAKKVDPAHVFRRDFDQVRPAKIEPGVAGRTRWFSERAGYKADARSLRRLRAPGGHSWSH